MSTASSASASDLSASLRAPLLQPPPVSEIAIKINDSKPPIHLPPSKTKLKKCTSHPNLRALAASLITVPGKIEADTKDDKAQYKHQIVKKSASIPNLNALAAHLKNSNAVPSIALPFLRMSSSAPDFGALKHAAITINDPDHANSPKRQISAFNTVDGRLYRRNRASSRELISEDRNFLCCREKTAKIALFILRLGGFIVVAAGVSLVLNSITSGDTIVSAQPEIDLWADEFSVSFTAGSAGIQAIKGLAMMILGIAWINALHR